MRVLIVALVMAIGVFVYMTSLTPEVHPPAPAAPLMDTPAPIPTSGIPWLGGTVPPDGEVVVDPQVGPVAPRPPVMPGLVEI